MQIITEPKDFDKVINECEIKFDDFFKAVVDIEKEIIAIDAELHADLEQELIEQGSEQKNIWGFNIYPERETANMIENYSLINIRPWQGNNGMIIEDKKVIAEIKRIVNKLLPRK